MTVSATSTAPGVLQSAATVKAATAASGSKATFDSVLASLRGTDATATATGAAAGTGSAASAASGASSADDTEDRFLKLLVAQMRNQDPLNPLDNAAVTSQLAQINTVRGIENLNKSLQTLVDRSGSGTATEAAAMVGRSVLVEGDKLELPQDGSARGGFELAGPATNVRVDVLDRTGAVVDSQTRANVAAGIQTFEWDGTTGTRTYDPGTYTLRVTATNGTDKVEATPLAAAPVRAVIRGTDGVSLQLGTYGSKPLEQIRAIL
jgi:flagellar basal-body rod modification protein FlgD